MTVQAAERDYALETLGWKAFQDLCTSIASEILGQTLETFHPSHDGGRDAAFQGEWKQQDGESLSGSFALQCKYSSTGSALKPTSLNAEVAKAMRLAARGLARNYLLFTNCRVTGAVAQTLKAQFEAIEGIEHFGIYGREWITQKIRESARLRMLVPRIYGLGDLSQILDARAKAQADAVLSALGGDISKLVVTRAYGQAARAVANHGFVLVLGEPAAGKSTIGASLAVGALDVWGCDPLKVLDVAGFIKHWDPEEPKRFFWIDDAFGTTQYQADLARDWNQAWPHLIAAIRRGARVLMTSRDYIYQAARRDLKATAFPLLNESQVVIRVQDLSKGEKEQILYNHLRLGTQPREFRTQIKPFLAGIANSERFLPEIARRLGNPLFTRSLSLNKSSLAIFVENPIDFLVEVITNLDRASQAALALVFMRGGALDSPVEVGVNEAAALRVLGVSQVAARDALVSLEGSLLLLVRTGDKATWRFKHPTVGDAYATMVAGNPELIDIYLTWTNPVRLIKEVTCGDVQLDGVKVIVPESRFEKVIDRLRGLRFDEQLLTFLATRCSRGFLAHYVRLCPELADHICEPRSYLSTSPATQLLATLHAAGTLPEDWRLRFSRHALNVATETPDLDCLSHPEIRALLQPQEIESILQSVTRDLVPRLPVLVSEWSDVCDSSTDPEEWFSPLQEVIHTIEEELGNVPDLTTALTNATVAIDDAIETIRDNRPSEEEGDYDYDGPEPPSTSDPESSIFDDVDD